MTKFLLYQGHLRSQRIVWRTSDDCNQIKPNVTLWFCHYEMTPQIKSKDTCLKSIAREFTTVRQIITHCGLHYAHEVAARPNILFGWARMLRCYKVGGTSRILITGNRTATFHFGTWCGGLHHSSARACHYLAVKWRIGWINKLEINIKYIISFIKSVTYLEWPGPKKRVVRN